MKVHRIHNHFDRVQTHYLLVRGVHCDVPQRRAAAVADVGVLQVGDEDVRHDADPVVLPRDLLVPAVPGDVPKGAAAVETYDRIPDVSTQQLENYLDRSDVTSKQLVVGYLKGVIKIINKNIDLCRIFD